MMAEEPKTRTIVVCLSRDRSLFSWVTYFADGGGLTHASIALDEDAEYYYSFNFKGFKREYITSLKKKPREMKRYKISVTEEQYQNLKRILEEMESEKGKFGYSCVGVSLCLMRFPNIAKEKDRYFCSEFVAKVLDESGCVKIRKYSGNYTPNDLGKLIENSDNFAGVTDDSTLKPIADTTAEAAFQKLAEAQRLVVDFSIQAVDRAFDLPFFAAPVAVRLAAGTTQKLETIFESTMLFVDHVKVLGNETPKRLAKETGHLLEIGADKVNELIDKITN